MFPDYNTACSFKVGEVLLGSIKIPKDNYVFVTDLAGQARSATTNTTVLNIATFLQTMAANADLAGSYAKVLLPTANLTAAYFPTTTNLQTQTTAQITTLLKSTNPGPGKTALASATVQANIQKNACAMFGICQTSASYPDNYPTVPAPNIAPPAPASGVVCNASEAPLVASSSFNTVLGSPTLTTSLSLNAAINCASRGYYIVQPSTVTTPPTAAQIMAGLDSNSQAASISGNGYYIGGTTPKTTLIKDYATLPKGTTYTLYFVAENLSNSVMQSVIMRATFTVPGAASANIGYLVDAPTANVAYTCGEFSGATGIDGSFLFPDYTTSCTFKVGEAILGTAKVPRTDNAMFITDLVGVTKTQVSDPRVLNIAQFLQTMATNSLGHEATVTPSVSSGKLVLPIPSANSAYFPTTVDIQSQTAAQLTALLKNNTGKTIVPSAIALKVLQTNLCSLYRNHYLPGSTIPAGSCGKTPPPPLTSGTVCSSTTIPTAAPLTTSTTNVYIPGSGVYKPTITDGVAITAGFDCATIGYYVIQPTDIMFPIITPVMSTPTAQQIINGQNAGGVPADIAGSAVYVGGTPTPTRTIVITDAPNFNKNISYTVYFVGVNALNNTLMTPVQTQNFSFITTGGEKAIPLMKTGATWTRAQAFSDGWYANPAGHDIGETRSYTNGGEIVFDNVTGLKWQDNVVAGPTTWINAAGICAALNTTNSPLANSAEWRLPTALELSYIVNYGLAAAPMINPNVPPGSGFANTASNSYWSSTQSASNIPQYSWAVSFINGSTFENVKIGLYNVRCVAQ